MRARSHELIWALLLLLVIGGLYLLASLRQGLEISPEGLSLRLPEPGEPFGHSLGIIGLALMLFTEIGYSLRKRSASARWGRTRYWLQAHILSGVVGGFLVLLHTGGNFRGLAGLTALLTVMVVASGFVGRYLYTGIPRGAGEFEPADPRTAARNARLRRWLSVWHLFHVPLAAAMFTAALLHVIGALYFVLPLR